MKKILGNAGAGILVCSLVCAYVLYGYGIYQTSWKYRLQRLLLLSAQTMYFPLVSYQMSAGTSPKRNPFVSGSPMWLSGLEYFSLQNQYTPPIEDDCTVPEILAKQAEEESRQQQEKKERETIRQAAYQMPVTLDVSMERLHNFEYLLKNFYTVDSSTMIGPEQLNAEKLLNCNMHLSPVADGPKVLIFHTHSQEAFADSVPGDTSTTIVGVGEHLTNCLNERGIAAIHDQGVYDIIDGCLDRSSAYENAEAQVRQILAENPSVEVAIDLHRDGVAEETRLVTDIQGKPTAKIMFFNGLSRTRTNGDIASLYNPYIEENLAFSLQMQVQAEKMYPGFARHIYLRGYRYNLHLLPKSLLIEAGAQTNTVEEMYRGMEVLTEILYNVLVGEG